MNYVVVTCAYTYVILLEEDVGADPYVCYADEEVPKGAEYSGAGI